MSMSILNHALQEARELGLSRTVARIAWEVKFRSGFLKLHGVPSLQQTSAIQINALPFSDPRTVCEVMPGRVASERIAALNELARDAANGKILCFGRWPADFGDPPD